MAMREFADGLPLNGLNRLAVAEALAQGDPESPGQGQVVQGDPGSPGQGQIVQAESRKFDRARLAAFGASTVRDIETPTGCTPRSLRSGPRLRETDAA